MPSPALLLILATLLPLGSFVVLVFVGKRMGNPLAGYVGTAAIAGSFVCSLLAVALWLNLPRRFVDSSHQSMIMVGSGSNPINVTMKWVPIGTATDAGGIGQEHPGFLDLGIYIDSLTVAMFAMITTVATLVHLYSIGYMSDEERFARFFTYLSLLCFSMLGLILGGTILHLLIFWELVGLCSYLLIGFWYERRPASTAAMKAFVVNRIGDAGLFIGLGVLFYHVGNLTLPHLWGLLGDAAKGQAVTLPSGVIVSTTMLTVIGIALFFGAIARSAQFPLHVWLPDAMEGPTPASALITTAMMVPAGVYFVARIYPILTPDARLFIAVIGLLTLTMGALIASVQTNIKRLLAFSTISQLGYMMLAIGVGSWVGGLFHLITHGFFKALLFLGAGSVIHAAHREQEMSEYGGLMRRIPVTAIAFGVGVLAIAGTPLMSAYYSREMILSHAAAFSALADLTGKSQLYWVFFVVPVGVAYLTAFYMARCWMLTFWGRPRNLRVYARAREQPLLYMPLLFMAVLSVVGGKYLGVEELLKNSMKETGGYVRLSYAKFDGETTSWPAELPLVSEDAPEPTPSVAFNAQQSGESLVSPFHSVPFYAFVGGIGAALLLYGRGTRLARRIARIAPFSWIHTWLLHGMYFDELYDAVFVSTLRACSALAVALDRYVIAATVNGVARSVHAVADLVGFIDKRVVDSAPSGATSLIYSLGTSLRRRNSRIGIYAVVLVAVALVAAVILRLSH